MSTLILLSMWPYVRYSGLESGTQLDVGSHRQQDKSFVSPNWTHNCFIVLGFRHDRPLPRRQPAQSGHDGHLHSAVHVGIRPLLRKSHGIGSRHRQRSRSRLGVGAPTSIQQNGGGGHTGLATITQFFSVLLYKIIDLTGG